MTTTAQIPLTISEPEKRSKRRGGLSRALVSYSFLAPWLIGFLGLTLGPTLASLYLSFTNFDLLQDPQFIGTANYQRIVTNDVKFWHSMQVTFTYVILAVPLKLALIGTFPASDGSRGTSPRSSSSLRNPAAWSVSRIRTKSPWT